MFTLLTGISGDDFDLARTLLAALIERADIIDTPQGPVLAAPLDPQLLIALELFEADQDQDDEREEE